MRRAAGGGRIGRVDGADRTINPRMDAATAEIPRKRIGLRLSTILAGLAEDGLPEASGPAAVDAEHASAGERPETGTESKSRWRKQPRSNLTIGDIVDRTRHAGFGFLTGFLALASIPFVGLSTPFGLAVAFGALQMVIGMSRPWLPKIIRRHTISVGTLAWLSQRVSRWTAGLERVIRPRFEILTQGPFWSLCGLCIIVQALGLSLPLPIPFSNWPFIIVLVLYAIGILERDGLLVMICHTLTVVELVLAARFWGVIWKVLIELRDWFIGIVN